MIRAGFGAGQVTTKLIKGVHSRAAAIVLEAREEEYGTIMLGRKGISRGREASMGRAPEGLPSAVSQPAQRVSLSPSLFPLPTLVTLGGLFRPDSHIKLLDIFIFHQVLGLSFHDKPAILQDKGDMGYSQGHSGVLFYQHQGDSFVIDPFDDCENVPDQGGRKPKGWLV